MQAFEESAQSRLSQNANEAKRKKPNPASVQSFETNLNVGSAKITASSLVSPQNEQNINQIAGANAKDLKRVQEEDEDFKNTWKKAPRVSKKLPSAFGGGGFQKSAVNLSKGLLPNKLPNQQEALQNIEQMVEIQEYKQVTNMLSPLKQKNDANVRKSENDMLMMKKKHDRKKHKNPLLPLKNYILLSKISEELIEKGEVSEEKLEKLNRLQKENAHRKYKEPVPLKLSSMITLLIMKSSHESGCVKKMLHAPTLKLYAVKEEPLNTREVRNNLKEWITSWQNQFEKSKLHLKVYACYWNSPEGCVSIVMEMMNNGSLQNLLESVGSLPEKAIKAIASPVLSAIEDVHNKLNTAHGAISPSQILFDRMGNIKLSLGISHRTNNQSGSFNHSGVRTFEKMSLHEMLPLNNPSGWQKQLAGIKDSSGRSQESFYSRAQDVYNFGFLLLICAVGGLEFFESSDLIDKIKNYLDENSKRPEDSSPKLCCIIHDEEAISSMRSSFEHSKSAIGEKKIKHITIIDFLKANRFSKEFVDFLCIALRFEPHQRGTIKDLKLHPFLTSSKEFSGPNVALTDLIRISALWTRNSVLPLEYQVASEKQLDRVCEALSMMLPNAVNSNDAEMKEYYRLEMLCSDNSAVQELSEDLGLAPEKVWKRIESCLKGINMPSTIS